MLTLSDGQKIFLDSVDNGTLAMQGKVKVNRNDAGEIVYNLGKGVAKNESVEEIQYNTLYNPRGSRVATLVLADGSKVWLNSESSVKYFTSVGKDERRVEITGEAYFEVAKDKTRPFRVIKKDSWEIQVLGTHFNVKAYENELQAEITLLEGSIDVVKDHRHATIKPGQQARIDRSIQIESGVDTEAIMAWKNGQFVFKGANLKTLMQQVERWYDIDVVFKGAPVNREFGGYLKRDISLKRLMRALQENQVACELQGRTLIIGK
jgi:ferric-dicitrate binding protein FerR (iron transport regulator)